MTERFGKKSATACFKELLDLVGVKEKDRGPCRERDPKTGKTIYNVGCFSLNPEAYVVEEITSKEGSGDPVFGTYQRSARDFCETVHFVRDVLRRKRGR